MVQLMLQIFFVIIILQAGGLMPLWFSYKVTRTTCFVMAEYLSLNVVMNFISKSKKEICYDTAFTIVGNMFLDYSISNVKVRLIIMNNYIEEWILWILCPICEKSQMLRRRDNELEC